jgi:hypothetical protein
MPLSALQRERPFMIPELRSRAPRLSKSRVAIFILLLGSNTLLSAAPDPYLIELKQLTDSAGMARVFFGYRVAISGDTAVADVPKELDANGSEGAACIFQRNAGGANNWGQVKKLTGQNTALFGFAVAIDGDTLVVGSGDTAYIYERNTGGRPIGDWSKNCFGIWLPTIGAFRLPFTETRLSWERPASRARPMFLSATKAGLIIGVLSRNSQRVIRRL